MAFKKSLLSRSLELAKLTVKVAAKEIKSGDLQSRVEQAKELAKTLSQLKGAAMKAGQMLSIELADYFPAEAAEILAQLQNNATASPIEDIHRILKKELNSDLLAELTDISSAPVASASVAQVHKAKWKNREVALKVQHEGVQESIASDLTLLSRLANAYCRISGREIDLKPTFMELREVLLQELDFVQEAKYLEIYRQKISDLESPFGRYSTPIVYTEMSTKRILTMSWEDGLTIQEWFKSKPNEQARESLAHLVLNLYSHEFFHWNLVQTDPNFSNFLIRRTGASSSNQMNLMQLVLLDFGSTRIYDKKMVKEYIEVLRAVEKGDPKEILELAYDFGLLDSRESEESKQLFIAMMTIAIEPFSIKSNSGKQADGVFDFSDQNYASRSRSIVKSFVMSLKYSPPPHRILFLHRKLGGIFALLKRLEVKINLRPYWDQMVHSQLTD